ncbi:YxiJ family protein [Solibacillus daqui]|uniref:YxiJ family protein n=1 Tax=Solibacillus daqui TaxID=2912187 RepID=UPI002365D78C|nr:YxiJ family protein [Solibacillus daqui]
MDDILKQLTEIEDELKKPFPTRDINKICEEFRTEFLNLSGEVDFYEDFRYYCVNIAGTLSYVLAGNINEIPQGQFDMLFKSFFEYYDQYEFLEERIANYNLFFQEYKTFEQPRKLLLQLLTNNLFPLD